MTKDKMLLASLPTHTLHIWRWVSCFSPSAASNFQNTAESQVVKVSVYLPSFNLQSKYQKMVISEEIKASPHVSGRACHSFALIHP